MDRVPIEKAIDQSPKPVEMVTSNQELSQPSTIDSMRDSSLLSSMLGFVHGFDGMNQDADLVMQWAREKTGKFSGPELLGFIKDTIRGMGTTEKGKSLLTKLRLFSALDTRQSALQKQKELL